MENKNKRKDWIDILAKLLPGIGAIIAGIFIPLVIHINAERSRNNQLYTEIVSKREMADTELRAKMFENLIKCFFGDISQQRTNKEKLTLLRLLALNFHEFFDLKPLFEELEAELEKEYKYKLREIAKEIASKQEAMLSHIKEGIVFERTLYKGKENGIIVPPIDQNAYRGHRLGITVTEIGQNDAYVYVKIYVIDIPEGVKNVGDTAEVSFELSFYDMPFIDNTKLFNATRFAITLKDIVWDENDKSKRKAARIKIIFFPESYMSSRDRPYLDEMLQQLRKSKKEI